jgi:hypothetical protein
MRAILFGFAGVAPRSVVPNLIEILSTLLSRATATVGDVGLEGGAVQWMKDVLMAVCVFFFFFFVFRFFVSENLKGAAGCCVGFCFDRTIFIRVRLRLRRKQSLSRLLLGEPLPLGFDFYASVGLEPPDF